MDRYMEQLQLASNRLLELIRADTNHFTHTQAVSWRYDIALCMLQICEAHAGMGNYQEAASAHDNLHIYLKGLHQTSVDNMQQHRQQQTLDKIKTMRDNLQEYIDKAKN